jgi:hypothetical protein
MMSCQIFCKGLSRLPAFRLQNDRVTQRPDLAFGPTISTDGVSIQYVFWLGGTHTDRQELPSFGVYDCHGAAASMCVGTTIILNVAYLLGDGRSEYLLGALINPFEK